jgi:hypothetical protein
VGPQGPPARAAPPLLKALRSARGSLLWTTWTSPHVGALPQPGVQFFASQGVQLRMSLGAPPLRRAQIALRSADGSPLWTIGTIRSAQSQNAPAAE